MSPERSNIAVTVNLAFHFGAKVIWTKLAILRVCDYGKLDKLFVTNKKLTAGHFKEIVLPRIVKIANIMPNYNFL